MAQVQGELETARGDLHEAEGQLQEVIAMLSNSLVLGWRGLCGLETHHGIVARTFPTC